MNIDHLTFKNFCEDITEDQLIQFEQKYRLNLPAGYRELLLKYNCVRIKPYGVVLKHTSEIKKVDEPDEEFGLFYGITDDNVKSIENNYQEYIIDGRVPSTYIPFAYSAGGDIFFMSLEGDTRGYIYYWCHEFEDEKPNMLHLADNLNDFLSNFREVVL